MIRRPVPENERRRVAAVAHLVRAARRLVDLGPSNRSGEKYHLKVAALDDLHDALDELEEVAS